VKKDSIGLLELETAVLECFLEKTPLSPLGVKLIGATVYILGVLFGILMKYFIQ
jgi:hypothetical protein